MAVASISGVAVDAASNQALPSRFRRPAVLARLEIDPTDDDGGRHGPDEHGHGGWHGLLYPVRKRVAEGSQQLPGLSQQPPALLRRRHRRELLDAAEDDEERGDVGVGGDDEREVPRVRQRWARRLDEGAGEEGKRGEVQARPAPPLQVDGYGVGFAGVRRVGGGGGTAYLLLGIVHSTQLAGSPWPWMQQQLSSGGLRVGERTDSKT
uniref:Uncharacterized protein n=1 Tax=Oryza nivara TaxID=4536 RepID=A0A0E0HAF2_ORYNI